MQHAAHIGSTLVIKGEISAKEPLMVSGRVDGTIDVPGHVVTIQAGAHVTAAVAAGGIVVSGAVTGHSVAEERIALHAGAESKGTLTAPRMPSRTAPSCLRQGRRRGTEGIPRASEPGTPRHPRSPLRRLAPVGWLASLSLARERLGGTIRGSRGPIEGTMTS
jgi:hypothetical protein